ncbi:DUF4446 family protein [Kribbella sp. NBC_01245]|uniref:DUF4446 family protein n=1 Tax=Kribbella sp. NBC_01245 TaxID=2903578 RepID=UPI002E2AA2CD|nr:DUF4446 family protein [Kribbella sp. NBC_01245]
MSPTLAGLIGLIALLVATLALVFAIQALKALRNPTAVPARHKPAEQLPQATHRQTPGTHVKPGAAALTEPERAAKPLTVKDDLRQLHKEVDALRGELGHALRHLAVVRYDAFGDVGGRLSWSTALLDDLGNGVVLTSINGRSDARSYAKDVREFVSESKLSPEEAEAIEQLRLKVQPATT